MATLGVVIGERTLHWAGREGTVKVEIGAPQRNREHDDYVCPYRIVGIGDNEVCSAFGLDSIQALWIAFSFIGSTLARHPDLRLEGSRELGFPLPPIQ